MSHCIDIDAETMRRVSIERFNRILSGRGKLVRQYNGKGRFLRYALLSHRDLKLRLSSFTNKTKILDAEKCVCIISSGCNGWTLVLDSPEYGKLYLKTPHFNDALAIRNMLSLNLF
jgi:hypothetical protein